MVIQAILYYIFLGMVLHDFVHSCILDRFVNLQIPCKDDPSIITGWIPVLSLMQ